MDFRYVIGEGDFLTKINQIRGFLSKGFKVRCVCKFKQREKAHKSQGFDLLNRVIEMLSDCAMAEILPKIEGSSVMCKLDMKKEVAKNELQRDREPNT